MEDVYLLQLIVTSIKEVAEEYSMGMAIELVESADEVEIDE